MLIPEGDCPCGGGKLAVDCCYQIQPPILRKPELQVSGLKLRTSLQFVDAYGLPVSPWFQARARGTFKVSDVFVIEDFIYLTIKRAHHCIAQMLPPFSKPVTKNQEDKILYERSLVDNLHHSLKSAHYHLQNLVFRFRDIAEGFSQRPIDIGTDGVTVVDQDFPLEFEFESYMMRYRTAVELTVKLIALKATGVDPRDKKKFDFKKTLDAVCQKPRTPSQVALADTITHNNKWLDEQRKIRNSIAHDGSNNVLSNFEHIRGKTLNATVLDRTADVMCLTLYRQLVGFCGQVVDALYSEMS